MAAPPVSAAPGAHLAGVGAELAITPACTPGEPSTTAQSRAARVGDHAGGLRGELLPDGVDESCRQVADHELRWPFVGRGDQLQSAVGNLFRYLPSEVFHPEGRGSSEGRVASAGACRGLGVGELSFRVLESLL